MILLDQFPRNMFRDQAEAFTTDRQALEVVQKAIHFKLDQHLSVEECVFLYMSFMHSVWLEIQEQSVELYRV